jgi:hypothetical protein
MIEPQELRAIVATWWEDTFVNDYVIDRSGNYRNAEDCIEDIVIRARAALAQPKPEGPSNEELLALMPETMRDEFSYAAKVCSDVTGGQVKPGIFRVALNTAALEYAQAVLACWGNL